ncbi:ribosome small subunit-dependent GTPase A [Pontibacter mangrovi]|uniref:Small ribosomal subunit biogenesis GTPase RsgA n=1 Tax=Pontibacter mangrovi TaxID=2589816 RepID=A0A501WA00_9BACT|nr:ribosome small subunit-dependent GTPase A [Pontibacter mangrovi]
MTLEELGYNDTFEQLRKENHLEDFEIGRVIAEHKERYIVKSEKGEFEAEITGNLIFSAKSREDFPAVGDWVALVNYGSDLAIIHSVLPRLSTLSRQAVGKFAERQIIATNIDFALLVQAVDRDFNINRLERYLTICYSSKVGPIIVLTKTDLIEPQKLKEIIENIKLRIKDIPIFAISNETKDGYASIKGLIKKGKTYCLLGSSGVGKSTLMNNLSGKNMMKTDTISKSTNKGRHVTSHRELTVIENGGILIDNPGMREIGVVDSADGLETAFDRISSFSQKCKFTDCTHTSELGCAVIEAVERGEIDRKSYDNFLKIEKEKDHFDLTVAEKRKKEKSFGKMVKNFKNDIQKISTKHNDVHRK